MDISTNTGAIQDGWCLISPDTHQTVQRNSTTIQPECERVCYSGEGSPGGETPNVFIQKIDGLDQSLPRVVLYFFLTTCTSVVSCLSDSSSWVCDGC